jgi:septum formation topological specificity factor MinE
VPECFKPDKYEELRKDMIEFIAKHQIPISSYYLRFISQELTPENIERVQNEESASET